MMNMDYPEDNFAQPFYRYKNSYPHYRGGYDRGNQFNALRFDQYGPSEPSGPPFPMFSDNTWEGNYRGDNIIRKIKRDKIVRHLTRCGLVRSQVSNLPTNILMMMHPSNCALCAQQFETYDLSKIHYLSKNHARSVKKWMTQQVVSGPKGAREPFKPRDVYCELCDVHITSKDHADSHYSGKIHLAIIDGRKNSRNPVLLQPHMKFRLRSLIRREKKALKKNKIEVEKKAKVDPSTVPPELYCDICKVAMTCSEQMTMHLNGKKHLSKEKNYILKQLKGETSGGGNASNEAEGEEKEDDEDDDLEEDEEMDEGGEGKRDSHKEASTADDDWGEGGGQDWKPSAEDY